MEVFDIFFPRQKIQIRRTMRTDTAFVNVVSGYFKYVI